MSQEAIGLYPYVKHQLTAGGIHLLGNGVPIVKDRFVLNAA